MRRIVLILCFSACTILPACSRSPDTSTAAETAAVAPLDERRAQFDALLKEQWEYTLQHVPELASILGEKRFNDRWGDLSLQAIQADLEATRDFLTRFEAIDTSSFPQQEALSHQLMVRGLREELDNAKFENWLMPVNQFFGYHIQVVTLASLFPVATVKDYEDYVARLDKLPHQFEQLTELMRQGMDKRLMPPKLILEQCVEQAEGLAKSPAQASPFAQALHKFPDSIAKDDQERIRKTMLTAISGKVQPAYGKLAAFLRDEYLPHGREELGLWALPDGDARYAAEVKQITTTDMTAEQIHNIGLREVARIEAEQAAIGKRLGFDDFEKFKTHVRNDRKLYARNREEILLLYRQHTAQMYSKLPELFSHFPQQKMTVEAVEAFREKQASGAQYTQGAKDGSRPGIVRVNTYDPTKRLTVDIESTAYHEGVPGHHMQIAIQQELGELPSFRQQARYTAFVEGWALYSERLGKEVGFYQDPYSDYGRLQNEMLRAIRLVVDTGLHSKHWTREQVVQYFHDHSTVDEPSVQSETDRYIAVPGQALGYKIGELTILRLREKAHQALGDKFDIRGFHDAVIGAGALPLDILEGRIDAWIARH